MRVRWVRSLRMRIFLFLMIVQLALVGVLAVHLERSWDSIARQTVVNRLSELSRLLNAALTPSLVNQDYASAYDLMEEMRGDNQLSYLLMYDRHGVLVSSSGWPPGMAPPALSRPDQAQQLSDVYHAMVPLKLAGETYGSLRYGISVRQFALSMRQLFTQSVMIALVGLLVSSLLLLLFGYLSTRGLYRLIEAADALAEGRTPKQLELGGGDEVALLSDHFNRMATALADRIDALQASEQKFHAIAHYTHDCEAWVSPEGRLLWVNPAIAPLTGYSAEECLAMPDFPVPLLAGTERVNLDERFRAALVGTSGKDFEYRGLRKDGSEYWGAISWLPIFGVDGRYLGLRASARDNTDYRDAQIVLSGAVIELQHAQAMQYRYLDRAARGEAQLKALLASMSSGILFIDTNDRVTYFNPVFLAVWRLDDVPGMIGMNFASLMRRATNLPSFCQVGTVRPNLANDLTSRGDSEYDMWDGRSIRQFRHGVSDDNGTMIGEMWSFEDITEQRRSAERLTFLAERDSLTGLYNRHRFQEELARMLLEAERQHHAVALLFFDLDEFKYINDTFGHGAGDAMLVRVSQEVAAEVRQNELLCRLGGDEFALLVPCAEEAEMVQLAERMVRIVEQITFSYDGQDLRMGTSVGVALYPQHATSGEELVAHADMAMYQAKAAGKNTSRLYRPDQNFAKEMVTRWSWNERIQRAIDEDLLVIFFQGIFDTNSRELTHFEALVRMHDDQNPGNLIMPSQFIPMAEKSGKIIEIDRWMLKKTIRMLGESPGMPPMSVNISGRSFDEPDLPLFIAELLAANKVDPARLYVELTETAAVSDMRDAQRFIDSLRSTGCHVCLDDFGTGFASFAYLKQLKVDVLKIDGLFIRDLTRDLDSQIFVEGMVNMAHRMGKRTIAEFVENEETLIMLQSFGVDMVQGFYLDQPKSFHPLLLQTL